MVPLPLLAQTPARPVVVHEFRAKAMPTGVAVSKKGRIFFTRPRWGDPTPATLYELKNGRDVPYPNPAYNRLSKRKGDERFVSVQSAVVDARDRLWALDTGSINFGLTLPGGPKLVCFDLKTNRVARVYKFPQTVALPTTYLNDVRFHLTSSGGHAFITDSSDKGPNGIIVLDLISGRSWRRLDDDPSTKASETTTAEGRPLLVRKKDGTTMRPGIGADALAIFPARDEVIYRPLISREMHSVPMSALIDESLPDDAVGRKVRRIAKGLPASDGILELPGGRLALTDYENHRVNLWRNGVVTPGPAVDPTEWPDSIALGPDGSLYVTTNQIHRQPSFWAGVDRRIRPCRLYKMRV